MKVLTLTTDLTHKGFIQFQKYYNHFGYEIEVLNPNVSNFGEQMPFIIDYCKQHPNESILYCDAWDTIALAPISEVLEKLPKDVEFYGGAERGCWPDANLIDKFPNLELPYKYLCGGTWYAKTNLIVEMSERWPNIENMNDQHWLQVCWLKLYEEGRFVMLDNFGHVFQSLMLDPPEAFKIIDNRVENVLHKVKPCILHGNGKVNMDKYYSIL